MGKKKNKPRVIPEQNAKLCRTICLCQLIMVLSCVSFVYLTVAIYLPSYRAFHSEFQPDPVMCQTIRTNNASNCSWASCNEWCLTSTSGYCPQIFATVRRSASNVIFENCSRIAVTSCPMVKPTAYKRFNCNNGTECAGLTGLFNCSKGICYQWDDVYLCNHVPDGERIDADLDNAKMNGFFQCNKSRCIRVKKQFRCDRYCPNITTVNINTILMEDDTLVTAYCKSAISLTESQRDEESIDIIPTSFWNETNDQIIMANCMNITKDNMNNLKGVDCLNGTIIDANILPLYSMNFTQFGRIYRNSSTLVDTTERYLPKQQTITIYNQTRLNINLEACVNTLRGECKEFVDIYGRDGRNDTAQSRYSCFYNPYNAFRVVLRFDLNETYRDLLIAAIVPSILFIVSCTFLCIITRSVRVGDDTLMRCKYCGDDNADPDDHLIGNRYRKYATNDDEPILSPSALQSPMDTEPGAKRELLRHHNLSSNSFDSDSEARPDVIRKSVTSSSRLGEEKPLVMF